LDEYPKVFVVGADNVGSRQMQKIRVSLRGHAGKVVSLFCKENNFVFENSHHDG
jgi:ribosomal protein L10